MSEIEIRDELKSEGVVEVHRVTVKKEGKVIPTNTLFLTFNRPDIPKEIVVGYLKVKVDLFVPNPLRCFNCNIFGHTSQRCRTAANCQRCGKDKHKEKCDGPLICSNCKSPHAVSVKDCPVWKKEKEIQRIRVEKCISLPEARQLVEATFPSNVSLQLYHLLTWSTRKRWLNLWSVRQISHGFLRTFQCRLSILLYMFLAVSERYRPVPRFPLGSQGQLRPTLRHCGSPR